VEATSFFFCFFTFYSALLTPFCPHFCFMPAFLFSFARLFISLDTPYLLPSYTVNLHAPLSRHGTGPVELLSKGA